MLDLHPQFIKTDSGDLVVLTRAEYDSLLRLAENEDAEDVAMFDARIAEFKAGAVSALPVDVSRLMLSGDPLLKALRKWRGDTQAGLAAKTGLAQGYLSDLENGKKAGTTETLRTIAEALDVDPKWLEADA